MADRTTIDNISAVQPDAANGVVHIECSIGSDVALLDLRADAVSTLALGLLQAGRAFKNNSEEFSGQPLALTGAAVVGLEDGRTILELVLDESLRVVVDIPDPAIPALQECLFALGELRGGIAPRSSSTVMKH